MANKMIFIKVLKSCIGFHKIYSLVSHSIVSTHFFLYHAFAKDPQFFPTLTNGLTVDYHSVKFSNFNRLENIGLRYRRQTYR